MGRKSIANAKADKNKKPFTFGYEGEMELLRFIFNYFDGDRRRLGLEFQDLMPDIFYHVSADEIHVKYCSQFLVC